jgi:hypothetical protein
LLGLRSANKPQFSSKKPGRVLTPKPNHPPGEFGVVLGTSGLGHHLLDGTLTTAIRIEGSGKLAGRFKAVCGTNFVYFISLTLECCSMAITAPFVSNSVRPEDPRLRNLRVLVEPQARLVTLGRATYH